MRLGAGGKGRGFVTGAGEGAGEFLSPVGDVAGGPVAVEHAEGGVAEVGELVEDTGRDVNGLAGGEGLAFLTEAHFAGAFEDEVNLLLLLVVPRDLAAARVEGDVAEAEVLALDGGGAPDDVLGAASGGITPAFDLGEVGEDHGQVGRVLAGVGEEGQVRFAPGFAADEEGEFAGVVIAPHRAFAVGYVGAGRDIIPAVGTMVDGMEEESLMAGVNGEIGFGEEGAGDGEAGRFVGRGGAGVGSQRGLAAGGC